MSDLPPDVERLETLRTWHQMTLDRIDRALVAARQREEEQQARRERAAAESRFKVEPGLDQQIIHRGGCQKWTGTNSYLDRSEVLLAIGDNALNVQPCPICRPDTALGPQN
ncbi:DUF6233 domain-containing protein [Streptomyces sp. NPDC056242]|uniref:DUF6233 domain-containing protein n=1 Tax=Streptomyces sp. NPDC056242 TaxID=3345760 RepID=UPI0035D5C020